MEAVNGSEGFYFEGEYKIVIPYEEISYRMDDGREVTILFTRNNGRTKIIETFEPEKINSIEKQQEGWQAILNNFKRYAEVKSAFSKPPKITHQIAPCLWFDNQAENAANYYVSIFKNSRILKKTYFTKVGYEIHGKKEGTVMTVEFSINGQLFTALNGGPDFKFSEAVSMQVICDTQEEIDYYWSKLSGEGEEGVCGWLKDKYGLSWQVVPSILPKLMSGEPDKAERVTKVLFEMKKLDIRKLKEA
jgi:predicted 3-demethylubiquinone-9 3-methyltransferase (glyoxalase superfamily)